MGSAVLFPDRGEPAAIAHRNAFHRSKDVRVRIRRCKSIRRFPLARFCSLPSGKYTCASPFLHDSSSSSTTSSKVQSTDSRTMRRFSHVARNRGCSRTDLCHARHRPGISLWEWKTVPEVTEIPSCICLQSNGSDGDECCRDRCHRTWDRMAGRRWPTSGIRRTGRRLRLRSGPRRRQDRRCGPGQQEVLTIFVFGVRPDANW
jgi:hypothetical protein